MPFWHTMDPGEVSETPRRKWDSWGPDEQARNIRRNLGEELDDLLKGILMEATIVHDLDLCADECKWLVPGDRPPYCYLFGALNGTRENGIYRDRECVRRATDIPEDAV